MAEDTLQDDVQQVEGSQSEDQHTTGDSGSDNDGNFLSVNDRTVYKTREDAIQAFTESGKRIEQLSRWEKEAKKYGLGDPSQLDAVARELTELRKLKAEAGKATSGGKQDSATHSDDDLSAEDKQALSWLKKMAPRLGYVPKDELDKMKEELEGKLNEVSDFRSGVEEQQRTAAIDHGVGELKKLITDAKMPSDKNFQLGVERFIRARMDEADQPDGENELKARFFSNPQERATVVKELFEEFKQFAAIVSGKSATSYAAQKSTAASRNVKPLPKDGSKGSGEGGKKEDKVKMGDPRLTGKAIEYFEKLFSKDADE